MNQIRDVSSNALCRLVVVMRPMPMLRVPLALKKLLVKRMEQPMTTGSQLAMLCNAEQKYGRLHKGYVRLCMRKVLLAISH
jgi:hypothetical protein